MTYREHIESARDLAAMIHLPSLPGTPSNTLSPAEIIDHALEQASVYRDHGLSTVVIENMHDVPYTKSVGPEISTLMAVVGHEIKKLGLYCGIQVLAGCNKEALAAAHSAGLDFVRVEGYVFSHVGDEGFFDSCAGELLRYRRAIGADDILVFTDIKKKHSSHALTSDVDLLETARAAEFFLSDGIIITGDSTGKEAGIEELRSLRELPVRKIIGSGITADNLQNYYYLADIFIVGSWLKYEGSWKNAPDPARVKALVETFNSLSEEKHG